MRRDTERLIRGVEKIPAHVVGALVVALVLAATSVAADNKALGKDRNKQGMAFVQAENYPAALEAFKEAYELYPKPAILFNIAMCHKALYQYVDAIDAFHRFIHLSGADINPGMEAQAREAIREMEKLTGGLRIEQAPDGAEVLVDSQVVGTAPFDKPLRLDPGQHAVQVVKEGYEPLRTTIRIVSDGETVLSAVLQPVQSGTGEGATAADGDTVLQPGPAGPADEPGRLWTWVALGVGGAAGVAGGVIGGVALSKKNTLIDECEDGTCAEEREGDRDTVKNLSLTADILYITAAVGVITGVILYFVEPGLGEDRTIAVTPTVTGTSAGIAVGGRF